MGVCAIVFFLSVIVHDLNIYRAGFAGRPFKADPPLIVNADAVLTFTFAFQRFKAVAGPRGQIDDCRGRFQPVLFGFRFGGKKKALSLSVDLEPIEVIMVIAVALRRKYSRCSARHPPLFAYFPNFWQQLATGDREWADLESSKSYRIESGSRKRRDG